MIVRSPGEAGRGPGRRAPESSGELFAVRVQARPDAIAIASALADRSELALLHDASGAGPSFVACDPDGETSALDPFEGGRAFHGTSELAPAPRFIGVLPYEAFRGLERPRWSPAEDRPPPLVGAARWLRYPAVARVDAARGEVMAIGTSRGAVRELATLCARARPALPDGVAMSVEVDDGDDAHAARVRAAIELVIAGDLYQVNVARRLRLALTGAGRSPSPLAFVELYRRLASAAPSAFGALLFTGGATVLGTSPELCLLAEPSRDRRAYGRLVTMPIKGTRPRGADAAGDRALALELDTDAKERAELAMIVDVERNDLSRVSATNTVRVLGAPRIETHRTVHHRVATVTGFAREGTSREDVLRAILPSGSVTGAPKIRAMEVIRALEPSRRGLYTGALGYVGHDGRTVLSMAIRTAVFDRTGSGEYFAGGGIVADSSPDREVAETHWKAAQLVKLSGRTER